MRYIFITILLTISTFSFSQDFTATYLVKFKMAKSSSVSNNMPPPPPPPPYYSKLQVKDGQTIYYEYMDATIVSKQGRDEISTEYSDLKSKKVITTDALLTGKGFVTQKITDWKVQKEAIDVKGMKAYLATKTINNDGVEQVIKAYFVPQISIPSGPSIYCGLPGLVVRVELPNEIISLVSYSRESISNFKYIDTTSIKLLDKHQFMEQRMSAMENNFMSIIEKRAAHQKEDKAYRAK